MNYSLLNLLNKVNYIRPLKSIHAQLIITNIITSSDLILNKLLRLYSRFGDINNARKLFDGIPQPNSFIWTALIHGYVENSRYDEALSMYIRMRSEAVEPLNFTIASVFKAISRERRVKEGEGILGFVLKTGFSFDLLLKNAILDFFMRCGEVDSAVRAFDEMDEKDVISWNTMIAGYSNNDRVDMALKLFDEMGEKNVVSWTSLINGYIKNGNIMEARILFDQMPNKDHAARNVMISGYVDVGDLVGARSVFEEMPIRSVETWNMMILGYCRKGDVEIAKQFFDMMPDKNVASWTMMIDGYIRSGDTDHARCLFDQMPQKNLISWSTMIGGYAKNGQPRKALELYDGWKKQGIKPDETFILAIISACSQLGILDTAESVINDFIGPSLFSNLRIVTSLIDMYAKCGSIERALQVFTTAYQKDLFCYSTMIAAFANHGMGKEAISLFEKMQREKNIKPDGVTYLGVLTACNHGGLVDEGRRYFEMMKDEYKIQPSEKHYACVVDLLGRYGSLEEAYEIIREMPIPPHSVVWGALLSACRVHRNVHLAEIAATELFKIEPNNSGNYILLSNVYADAGVWGGVAKVRAMVRENRVKKNRASSWIELGCTVHEFVMGDTSHFDSEDLYFALHLLVEDMKLLGHSVQNQKTQELHHQFMLPYKLQSCIFLEDV